MQPRTGSKGRPNGDAFRRLVAGVVAVTFALPAVAGAATGSPASPLRHTYAFDPARLLAVSDGTEARLRVGGLPSTWEHGRPEMPYDLVTFLVPAGTRVARVSARAVREQVFLDDVALAGARARWTSDGLEAEPPAAKAVATGAALYPAALAEAAGAGALHGYQMVSVRVYPVRYEAANRRTFVAERIDLEIELEGGAALPITRERWNPAVEAGAKRALQALVANPEDIDAYDRRIGARVESARRGFHPADAPSVEGSEVEYIIVTSAALAPHYQVLADWKTQRGVPTVVRTLEWIQDNYRQGSDLAETVRYFLQDAYIKWSVRYVLLGGDTDVLPARYGFSEFGPATEEEIPTDLYFAGLDGNWNADGDAVWGEAAFSVEEPVDDVDNYAEIFVGRLPTTTAAEVDKIVAKVMMYENPAQTVYQNRLLLLGEVLFPVDWAPGITIQQDAAEFTHNELLTFPDSSMEIAALYENNVPFPYSIPLTLGNTIATINDGYGIVNHIGHGYRYNMSCGDLSFGNHNAYDLTNTERPSILYMLNCTAAAFDFPCLAEAFLFADGGAVAVLGSTRAAFVQPAQDYNRGFFEAVFDSNVAHIGDAFVQSRLPYTPNAYFDTSDHYSHLLYNLLADPEMVVHTGSLAGTAPIYPDTLGLGVNNVLVHVDADGIPREGALVCLQKGEEEYVYGRTDANGDVMLEFIAESGGQVQLTVSGQNITTAVRTLTVVPSGAWVSVASMQLDDDQSGGSNGNGDGKLDVGEVIQLSAVLRNLGHAGATGVTGVLRIDNVFATVLDSTFVVGDIDSAGTAPISGLRFSVAGYAPDGMALPLTFVCTDSTSSWTDVVHKVVHAPWPELTLLAVYDPPPGGNGNLEVDAGETFELRPVFKNYGTGSARGLVATLQSSDADITLIDSVTTLANLASQQELAPPVPFVVTEDSLYDNWLQLFVQDAYGNAWGWELTLRRPQPPTDLIADASKGLGIIETQWTRSPDLDVAGYHLYRSNAANGPWTRLTQDRTRGIAYFRDTGLLPSTKYFYRATAVDSGGNESAPSVATEINTNPAQLAGWPIVMGSVSSCPPAIGDINGDGANEVVAGNDHLYAWTYDGTEMLDADLDPQTWGVFVDEIRIVTAAIVLAEFDANAPGLEVFATSWTDSNLVLMSRGDGSVMPGWPQKPDPTTAQTGYWGSPAAMDIDGDGIAEVFAPGKNGHLYAWHADGTPVGASAAFKPNVGIWSRCSPSFANLDGDPEPEIVYVAPNATLNVWNPDGTDVPNFPRSLGTICLSTSAIGDVNGDGRLDIVVVVEDDSIHVVDSYTGQNLPGWPRFLSVKSDPISPSPALADFDNDGRLEIVVANNATTVSQSGVRILDYQGNTLPGWPRSVNSRTSESSPIVADVSGDGVPDVLFGNESGFIFGWDVNGNVLPGFPLTIGDFVRSTPFAGDVDGDGDVDLVFCGWDQQLWIWDFATPYSPESAPWPTFKHDAQRTGSYTFRSPTPPTDVPGQEAVAAPPARAFLDQNVPNPFNPLTNIRYGVPIASGAEKVPVRIDVYDVAGRRVRQLVRGSQTPGVYAAIWDGRSDRGERVQSGVYFYRLQVGADVATRKMVMLK